MLFARHDDNVDFCWPEFELVSIESLPLRNRTILANRFAFESFEIVKRT